MMDDKTREQIILAERAKDVLDNDAYQEAWRALMDGLQKQRAKLQITDKDGAQALLVCERMALKFRSALEGFISTGKLVQEQLRLENERRSMSERFMPPWMRKAG